MPKAHPPIAQLFVGSDGSFWLRTRRSTNDDGPVEWRGFDAEGRLVGSIQCDAESRPIMGDKRTISVIEFDSDGVDGHVRYRFAKELDVHAGAVPTPPLTVRLKVAAPPGIEGRSTAPDPLPPRLRLPHPHMRRVEFARHPLVA